MIACLIACSCGGGPEYVAPPAPVAGGSPTSAPPPAPAPPDDLRGPAVLEVGDLARERPDMRPGDMFAEPSDFSQRVMWPR